MNGIRCIGIGEYGIFEDDLKELMEAKVIVSVANELGLFDGCAGTMFSLSCTLGWVKHIYDVADSLVATIIDATEG